MKPNYGDLFLSVFEIIVFLGLRMLHQNLDQLAGFLLIFDVV